MPDMRTLISMIVLTLCIRCGASDWPQWRGGSGQGQTDEANLPVSWDGRTGQNILWKAALPKADNPYSSPIVKGDRVIVTLAMNKAREHHVLCFDKNSGKPLWDTVVPAGLWVLTDLRGGYGAPTPASDDRRIYVLFGSAVMAALDFEGKILWRVDLPRRDFDVAIGCSPLLFGETIILQADMIKKQSSLIAFDKSNGEIRWEVKRPDVDFAHGTPTLVSVGERPMMLVAASNALQGVDPANGQVLWSCKARGDTVSPVYGNGVAYVDSGRGGPGFAVSVDPAMKGDVTKTHLRWMARQIPEGFGSPMIVGDYVYRLHSPGVLKCFALADGKEIYSQRLEGATAAASPVATKEGVIYFASSGRSYVIKAGPHFEQIASNNLDDPNYASAAVSDGRIYLKGQRLLYCIGAAKP
jgi:outer membrane protein assembly factor BamB